MKLATWLLMRHTLEIWRLAYRYYIVGGAATKAFIAINRTTSSIIKL
jgi:hypothetical protein